MKSPRVTVVLPTYNRAPFLEEVVGSVVAQSMEDFELLVVDDGSTDDTQALPERVWRSSEQPVSLSSDGVSLYGYERWL